MLSISGRGASPGKLHLAVPGDAREQPECCGSCVPAARPPGDSAGWEAQLFPAGAQPAPGLCSSSGTQNDFPACPELVLLSRGLAPHSLLGNPETPRFSSLRNLLHFS